MIISVINHTKGKVTDEQLHVAIRAINRQISYDFEPYWSMSAKLRLEGRSETKPTRHTLADMRGDAVLYIWDEVDVDDALGYHDRNDRGIPYGFVFVELSEKLEEDWSVTLSHEALELIGDPETNLLVVGPNPEDRRRNVFHWFEMCDAVQDESYEVDGVKVSNFVFPFSLPRVTSAVAATTSSAAVMMVRRSSLSVSIRAGTWDSMIPRRRPRRRTRPSAPLVTNGPRSAWQSKGKPKARGAR